MLKDDVDTRLLEHGLGRSAWLPSLWDLAWLTLSYCVSLSIVQEMGRPKPLSLPLVLPTVNASPNVLHKGPLAWMAKVVIGWLRFSG